ncbi:hypothetical protein Afil01_31370 [Actinorhabdospora filicis]|uniref:Uncharacterized protein n=1 Tax=Actinorhabdospora filicis TaxID=1785913 RepID=A0A9W6SLY2_9ACTN|nr:hypothetical protein [Actinorhabdospora filicis]GLZ78330.1 hypothetical protein Afil01_31370 [Actinorhabdospora filicis]
MDSWQPIQVKASSPGRVVTATYSPDEGVRFAIDDRRLACHDDLSLSGEITAVIEAVLIGARRAWELRYGPYDPVGIAAVRVRGVSPRRLVTVTLTGEGDVDVRLSAHALEDTTRPGDLAVEIGNALSSALTAYVHHAATGV